MRRWEFSKRIGPQRSSTSGYFVPSVFSATIVSLSEDLGYTWVSSRVLNRWIWWNWSKMFSTAGKFIKTQRPVSFDIWGADNRKFLPTVSLLRNYSFADSSSLLSKKATWLLSPKTALAKWQLPTKKNLRFSTSWFLSTLWYVIFHYTRIWDLVSALAPFWVDKTHKKSKWRM